MHWDVNLEVARREERKNENKIYSDIVRYEE